MLSSELAVHYNIRQHFGTDRVTLSQLRGNRTLLNDWLRATPPVRDHGCPWSPPDRTPLRVELHAEDIEFGYELVQVAPYAHAACLHGVLELRSYCTGMNPFYFFTIDDMVQGVDVVACKRHAFHPNATYSMFAQHARPVGRFWERQPPYRDWYYDLDLKRAHPGGIALVLTKQGAPKLPAWAPSGMSNTWSEQGLRWLLQNLSYCADRVYYHHADGSYPEFVLAMESHGDLTLLREFEYNKELRELTHDSEADALNRAQLRLAATADVVVAAQGGGAVLASLVATQLLILCRAGQECFGRPPDVVWWRHLNNATIETHIDEDVLTRRAVEMLPR